MKKIIFIAALTAGTLNAIAQKQISIKDFNIFDSTHTVSAKTADSIEKVVSSSRAIRDTVVEKVQQQYLQFTMDYRVKVFNWQYYSTIMIFFIVIGIVLAGLYMSYLQFKAVFLPPAAAAAAISPENDAKRLEGLDTNLEMSKDGIKIHSGVIGLIILTLSVLFFFLYLKYIYNITIVH